MSNAWNKMEIIRHKDRPTVLDYIPAIFTDFYEMHGDRYYGDDAAIMAGIAHLKGTPVTVIAEVKGRNFEENQKSNFAMPHPEGYRKALRLAKQAAKFGRPVICFVDTPGAYCGVEAEERGQGEAIARNLYELITLPTPIITVVLGEGGSGGALALSICDELAMLENAVYSVISPRGAASILWKDPTREQDAAEALKITADDLKMLDVADTVISEPVGGAHNNPVQMAENLQEYLIGAVKKLSQVPIEKLLANRYNKFRKVGDVSE
ncbi:MAG TPA: acetyl-CoA carboxylase carboxyltransferase subunit alpha [Candidatus Egerieicola faecale]|uniref:Acetyl-coenzyme A carboxylase carboxyl transferase subunit alpha n=1 Tax=Candidatus Egerieicola faecale TaxID=2840774 RepID=A0A9D1IQA0_9FIRM|nr:acetyl-CoA carboxylase carboxyltransferase subunit alpha [Candidatus Egerieicola faecale]